MQYHVFFILACVCGLMTPASCQNDVSLTDIFSFNITTEATPAETATTPAPKVCGQRVYDLWYRMTSLSESADYPEFIWTIAIFDLDKNSFHCAGSLIHPQVVLSVAHRFKRPGRWSARAGGYYLNGATEPLEVINIEVEDVVLHPTFNPFLLKFNMALLFLKSPFPSAEHIGTICLPPSGTVSPAGTKCIVSGWGHEKWEGGTLSDGMKMIELPIVESGQCEQTLRTVLKRPSFNVHRTMICAGGEKDKDACRKDGGAALACPYLTAEGRYYQAGIVSFGSGCGKEGVPGVYTNVAELRPWIDQTMKSRGFGLDTYTFTQ